MPNIGAFLVFGIGFGILFLISFLIHKAKPDKLILKVIPQIVTGAISVILFVQTYAAGGWDALAYLLLAMFFGVITVLSLIAILIVHFVQKGAK